MSEEFKYATSEGPNGWTIWQVIGRIDVATADEAYASGEKTPAICLYGLIPTVGTSVWSS